MTRVKKVACSAYHCAAVTDVGLLFTWGTGADGALGHGNEDDVLEPKLVETFGVGPPIMAEDELYNLAPKKRKVVLVKDVGCGADILGAHTAAVTTGGQVYTWGIAGAIGHYGRSSSIPKVLGPMPGSEDVGDDDEEDEDDDKYVVRPLSFTNFSKTTHMPLPLVQTEGPLTSMICHSTSSEHPRLFAEEVLLSQ